VTEGNRFRRKATSQLPVDNPGGHSRHGIAICGSARAGCWCWSAWIRAVTTRETATKPVVEPLWPEWLRGWFEPLDLGLFAGSEGDGELVVALAELFDRRVEERRVLRQDECVCRPRRRAGLELGRESFGKSRTRAGSFRRVVKCDEIGERGEHGLDFVVTRKRPTAVKPWA